MGKLAQLRQEHQKLREQYADLYAQKAEIEYAYRRLQEEQSAWILQDEEIRLMHENARRLKHDMKNHFMVLSAYLASKDYQGADTYISEILDKLAAMNSYVETGNALMNHIVNEKLQSAGSKGIKIKAEIENLSFSKMKKTDFSALLSNMLDNAIEASVREPKENRHLQLVVSERRGYEVICVKNKISGSVLQENPNLQSYKPDPESHGIGIPRMKEIVEYYHGIFDIYEKDAYFCMSAFIPK